MDTHGPTVLTIVIKAKINHYICAEQGRCYHGDLRDPALLCISTATFTIAAHSAGWVEAGAAADLPAS